MTNLHLGPRDRVQDVYFTEDYPVLLSIAQWELSEHVEPILRSERIAERLGRSHQAVTTAIGRLFRGGYVEVAGPLLDQTDYYIVRRLTPSGLREVGAWPTPGDLADAFKKVIEHEAMEAETTDPEKGKKLRQILETAEDLGTSFLAKVTAELIKTATHMP